MSGTRNPLIRSQVRYHCSKKSTDRCLRVLLNVDFGDNVRCQSPPESTLQRNAFWTRRFSPIPQGSLTRLFLTDWFSKWLSGKEKLSPLTYIRSFWRKQQAKALYECEATNNFSIFVWNVLFRDLHCDFQQWRVFILSVRDLITLPVDWESWVHFCLAKC